MWKANIDTYFWYFIGKKKKSFPFCFPYPYRYPPWGSAIVDWRYSKNIYRNYFYYAGVYKLYKFCLWPRKYIPRFEKNRPYTHKKKVRGIICSLLIFTSCFYSRVQSCWLLILIVWDVKWRSVHIRKPYFIFVHAQKKIRSLPAKVKIIIIFSNFTIVVSGFLIIIDARCGINYKNRFRPASAVFSDISERNNDYSGILDFGGKWGWSGFSFWRSLITNPQC